MTECQHKWKKWEKEQHIFWEHKDKEGGYYQRRECKACGTAEWKPVQVQDLTNSLVQRIEPE